MIKRMLLFLIFSIFLVSTASASWVVGGEGGNAWSGNSMKDNTTLNRDTNRIMLRQEVDNYLSYYRLDGSSSTTSYDENLTSNYNGTLTGATWVFGKYGNATNFDGADDKVNFGDVNALDNINRLTVLVWTKPTTLTTNDVIIHNWNFATPYAGFYIGTGASTATSVLWGIVGGYGQSTLSLSDGGWSHLAMVYNGTESTDALKLKGYVNGVQKTITYSATISTTTGNSNIPLMLGLLSDNSRDYNGIIDDVHIYTRVLTNDEINQTMNNTMKSQGNLTTWYDSGAGNETHQIDVNTTTDANSNYTVWYANNGTESYTQLGGTLTGNNSLTISGTKYQNTDVQVRLAGNTTSTPELIAVTFWTQPAEAGGTLYERSAEDTVTVTESAGRTVYTFRGATDSISITEGSQRIYYGFRSVSDAATITEYASATFIDVGEIFTRYASDAMTVAEGATRQLTYVRFTSDSISITEGSQRMLSAFRSASTSITITDSAARTAIYNRAVQQAISIAENVQLSLIEAGELFIRYASDTITVLEGAASSWWESAYYIVSGFVTNILSSPLEDARVEYVGDANYTFTDAAGYYAINVPAGEDRTILSRAIGYRNDTETIDISGNVQQNFTLSERTAGSVTTPGFSAISGIFIMVITLIVINMKKRRD